MPAETAATARPTSIGARSLRISLPFSGVVAATVARRIRTSGGPHQTDTRATPRGHRGSRMRRPATDLRPPVPAGGGARVEHPGAGPARPDTTDTRGLRSAEPPLARHRRRDRRDRADRGGRRLLGRARPLAARVLPGP